MGNFRENWPGMEGIQTDEVAGLYCFVVERHT
jgi:hypothetical protein